LGTVLEIVFTSNGWNQNIATVIDKFVFLIHFMWLKLLLILCILKQSLRTVFWLDHTKRLFGGLSVHSMVGWRAVWFSHCSIISQLFAFHLLKVVFCYFKHVFTRG